MFDIVKQIGIDFGSSNTSVVGVLEDYTKSPIVFRYNDVEPFSTMLLRKHNSSYFFTAAEVNFKGKDINDQEVHFYNALKEDLMEENGKDEYSKRVEEFFKELKRQLEDKKYMEQQYSFDLDSICFGYPISFDKTVVNRYREKMRNIVERVFQSKEKKIKIYDIPEPVLAGRAYNYAYKRLNDGKSFLAKDETLLVVDLGGYTMDIALLQASGDKEQELAIRKCVSLPNKFSSGKNITKSLCKELYGKRVYDGRVDRKKRELFEQLIREDGQYQLGSNYTPTKGAKYPKEGKDVTFALHYDMLNPKSYTKEKGKDYIDIGFVGNDETKDIQFERRINDAVDFIRIYLSEIPKDSISYVLFTGGTAKIKPLRDGILQGIKDWLTPDNPQKAELLMDDNNFNFPLTGDKLSSENAVALGAALTAAGICKPLDDMASPFKGKKEDKDKKIEELEAKLKERTMERDLEKLKLGELSEAEAKRLVEEYKKRFSSN